MTQIEFAVGVDRRAQRLRFRQDLGWIDHTGPDKIDVGTRNEALIEDLAFRICNAVIKVRESLHRMN